MSTEPEKPNRLTPVDATLRRLYLHSGNLCAFEGCEKRIIGRDGVLNGQVCHIEAAMPGGERFNQTMTNEQRRAFDNLVLLCDFHHRVTNDESVWTVEKLKAMKAAHEAAFSDPINQLAESLVDHTTSRSSQAPISLRRMNEVLAWKLGDEELEATSEYVNELAAMMRRVPRRALQLLGVIVDRGRSRRLGHSEFIQAQYFDVREALELTDQELQSQLSILEEHGLASGQQYFNDPPVIETKSFDWQLWKDLKTFCEKTELSVAELLADRRFDLLD